MDLTEAFTAFLAPSARDPSTTELNESVDTFISSIGGFPALLTLLQSQTEDAAEDLMFSDIMRRTAARVFSSSRGLELLSASSTEPFLIPLISSSPGPIFSVILDGLEHCIRYYSRSRASSESDAASTAKPAWRVGDAIYAALLARCRVSDSDIFRDIISFIAFDSVANDPTPRRILSRPALEALAGGPLAVPAPSEGTEGVLGVDALRLGEWDGFASVVTSPEGGMRMGTRDDDLDDDEGKPMPTRSELAAAAAAAGTAPAVETARSPPLTVGVEVFRTRIIDLLLSVASAHDAASGPASSRATKLTPAQAALAAAGLPEALTALAFPTSTPAPQNVTSVDPMTVLVSLALLSRWGTSPHGAASLAKAGVPALARETLLTHCSPYLAPNSPSEEPSSTPAPLRGAALLSAASATAAAVAEGSADVLLDTEDEAAVQATWLPTLPGLPAGMVIAGVLGVMASIAKGTELQAVSILTAPSAGDDDKGMASIELAALLCGYSRISSLHGAVGAVVTALAASPRGLLWCLNPSRHSKEAGAGVSPLMSLLSLAFVYEDVTRASALHAIATVIAPKTTHYGAGAGANAAAEFVRTYIVSVLSAPRLPSPAALARITTAAAAMEASPDPDQLQQQQSGIAADIAAALPHVIASLMSSARSILEELQFASLHLLRAIASRPWGARALLKQQGFDQFLVSKPDASSHESLKLNFDWKQQIARLLIVSPAFLAPPTSVDSEPGVGLSTFERGRLERFALAGSMAQATAGTVEDPTAQMG